MQVRNGNQLLELMRGYQIPCVLAAAADLGVFQLLAESPMSAAQTAERLACHARAMTVLFDALAAIPYAALPIATAADVIFSDIYSRAKAKSDNSDKEKSNAGG